jgi:hypothetical protein
MKVQLSTRGWSGGSIEISAFRFGALRWGGVLEFEAKGSDGGELLAVGLGDQTNSVARIFLGEQGMCPQKWRKFSIPPSAFPEVGLRWDNGKQTDVPCPFFWDKINKFVFDNNGPGQGSGLFLLRQIVVRWEE